LLHVGFSYDVSPPLGARLVSQRCAELLASQEPMLLVPVIADSKPQPDVAADEGLPRESMLSFERS
jgi:hypothetical protein